MAVSNAYVGVLPPYDTTISWLCWKELFDEYCSLNKVRDESVKTSLFLTHIGSANYSILHSTCLPGKPKEKSIDELCQILELKHEPPGLEATNRYIFHRRMQNENESATDYILALQEIASKCKYTEVQISDALKDQLVCGLRSESTRRKLLSTQNLTYDKAKEIFLQEETIQKQVVSLHGKNAFNNVNKVNYKNSKSSHQSSQCKSSQGQSSSSTVKSYSSQV